MKIFIVFCFFRTIYSLSIYIQNKTYCNAIKQDGTNNYPFCSIIPGFLMGETHSLNSNESDIYYILKNTLYQIDESDLLDNNTSIFSRSFNKNIKISSEISNISTKIIINTPKLRFNITNIITINDVIFQGSDYFIQNKLQTTYILNYSALYQFYPLFEFINTTKMKTLNIINCSFENINLNQKLNSFATLILIRDHSSTVSLINCTFNNLFFSHNLIYLATSVEFIMTVTNCNFLNYNILENIIKFTPDFPNYMTISATYQHIFAFIQNRSILNFMNTSIQNVSYFIKLNNSLITFRNTFIIKRILTQNAILISSNSSTINFNMTIYNSPNQFISLNQQNIFTIKYLYVQSPLIPISILFTIGEPSRFMMTYFYIDNTNIQTIPLNKDIYSKALLKFDKNCAISINNAFFTNILFYSPLMIFTYDNITISYISFINVKFSKPMFCVKDTVNFFILENFFAQSLDGKNVIAGNILHSLKISNIFINNLKNQIDNFISSMENSTLELEAIFTNIQINSTYFDSFSQILLNSNISFVNSRFIDIKVNKEFLRIDSIKNGNISSFSLFYTEFINIESFLLKKESHLTWYFLKFPDNMIFTLNSVFFDKYNLAKIPSLSTVFIQMGDNNIINITNLTWGDISDNTPLLIANDNNIINIDRLYIQNIKYHISFITVKDSNIITLNQMYFEEIHVSSIFAINGAIFSINYYNYVKLENSIFQGIYSNSSINHDGKGGCFNINNGNNFNITNCNFSRISSIYGSIGYFLYNNQIVVNISNFNDIRAERSAAAFFLTESNDISIISSNFSNLSAAYDSGMIFLSITNSIILTNIFVFSSITDLCGGSIYALSDNEVTVEFSSFSYSISTLSGALFYFASSNVVYLNNIFVFHCKSYQFPYAIDMSRFNYFTSTLMIWKDSDGIFNGYKGIVMGSEWYLQNIEFNKMKIFPEKLGNEFNENILFTSFFTCFHASFSITDLTVRSYVNNVIMNLETCQLTARIVRIYDSKIFDKKPYFYMKNSEINFQVLRFDNITGDIFHIYNSSITLSFVKFIGSGEQFMIGIDSNTSIYQSSFIMKASLAVISQSNNVNNGGFFSLENSIFSIIHSIIAGGFSSNGGGISLINTKLVFIKNICLLNIAKINGGCIHITHTKEGMMNNSKRKIFLKKSYFSTNTAQSGGAIYLKATYDDNKFNVTYNLTAEKLFFRLNKANKGGAIYKDEMSVILAYNLKFIGNKALSSNVTGFGKGGAFYTNCTAWCFIKSENFFNLSFFHNIAAFGGAVYLEQNPFDNYSPFYIEQNNISFDNNLAYYYGNEFATVPASIYIRTMDSSDNKNEISLTNLVSGYQYDCLFYIIGTDFFGNIFNIQENPLPLYIKETSNYTIHELLLQSDYNNLACAKGALITNPRPRLNLSYEVSYRPKFNKNKEFSKITINLSFRSCLMGERQTDDFRCESCPINYYSFHDDSTEKCLPCSDNDHFNCLGSSFLGPKEGYWRLNYYSDNFIRCPNPSSCLGYSVSDTSDYVKESSTGLCKEGYKGVLCAECDRGYGVTNGYFCTDCGSFWYSFNIIFFFAFRLFLIIYSLHSAVAMCTSAAAGLLKTKEIISATIMKILMNHFQVLNMIVSFPFEWKKSLYDWLTISMAVSPSISDSYSVQCLFQILNIHISTHFIKIISIWCSILFLMGVCYAYHRVYLTKKIKFYLKFIKKTENDILESTYFIILFIVYLDILSVCLETFSCRNIGYGNIEEYRLIKDYSVKCWNENHKGWAYGLVIPFFVLFGVGFPISIFYVLVRKKRKNKLNRQDLMLRYGYFYLSYEKEYFYWDFVILIRKILLSFVNIFLLALYTGVFSYIVTLMLLILLVFLYLQIECKPYLKKELKAVNNLEKYSLISLSATMFFAIFGGDTYFSQQIGMLLFLFGVALNMFFFLFWGILYYESDFKKTLKTILYFSLLCLTAIYHKIRNLCADEPIQPHLSRRRGVFRTKAGNVTRIFFDLERYKDELMEIEIIDNISKIKPPEDYHLQLDFAYFSTDNMSIRVSKSITSRNTSKFERTSTTYMPPRYSKFFTIDSSPGGKLKNVMNKSDIENLKNDNKTLNDNLKKAKKEIHDLKYLLIINQEFHDIEGKEKIEKSMKDDQFFLQEILINYENFLKTLAENIIDEDNLRAMIQNEGVLFKDERIQIDFKTYFSKINTNNPNISVKLKISNISYILIQNLKICYKNQEIMQIFPDINNVNLLQNQHINQNISLSYKTGLLSPLHFVVFYQIKGIEYKNVLVLPITLMNLLSLVETTDYQFYNLWKETESIRVEFKVNRIVEFERTLKLFQEKVLFNEYLISLKNTFDDKKIAEDLKKNIVGKFGLMFKSLHDGQIYLMKFIFKNEGLIIESKVQRNNVESFRFLEYIIDTITVSLR